MTSLFGIICPFAPTFMTQRRTPPFNSPDPDRIENWTFLKRSTALSPRTSSARSKRTVGCCLMRFISWTLPVLGHVSETSWNFNYPSVAKCRIENENSYLFVFPELFFFEIIFATYCALVGARFGLLVVLPLRLGEIVIPLHGFAASWAARCRAGGGLIFGYCNWSDMLRIRMRDGVEGKERWRWWL